VEFLVYVTTALAAYLLGSVPFGFLAGKARGIDIRTVGSGNIGATNAFRILGKTAGMVVLVADGLKGWLAVRFLPELAQQLFATASWSIEAQELLRITAGVGVILGHNYTCWLKFKGGKGIATSAGVLAALVPWAFVITLVLWVVICLATRYVSMASIIGSLALPFVTWAAHYSTLMIIITSLMSTLAIYKHKANIVRLMNGTENKIGRKKNPAPPATKTTP
jgi:acyl phosphate:glycerol-3-phosphate acyltransferase